MIFKGVTDSLVKECETKTKFSDLEACITFSLWGMKKRPKFVVLPYKYVKEFLFYRQSDFFNELLSENIESIAIHKEYNDIINENYNQIALEQDIQVVNIMNDYGFEPYDEIKYQPKRDTREHTAIVFNRVNNENGDSVLYLGGHQDDVPTDLLKTQVDTWDLYTEIVKNRDYVGEVVSEEVEIELRIYVSEDDL